MSRSLKCKGTVNIVLSESPSYSQASCPRVVSDQNCYKLCNLFIKACEHGVDTHTPFEVLLTK